MLCMPILTGELELGHTSQVRCNSITAALFPPRLKCSAQWLSIFRRFWHGLGGTPVTLCVTISPRAGVTAKGTRRPLCTILWYRHSRPPPQPQWFLLFSGSSLSAFGSLMQPLQEVDIFIMVCLIISFFQRLFREGIICKRLGPRSASRLHYPRRRLRLFVCQRCHRTALFLKRSLIFCMLVKKVQYWRLKVDS